MVADLRNDLKRRFDSLELYIKKEVEAITDRVKTEQTGRMDALKELSSELNDLAKGIEKKTTLLEDQASKAQRDLRQQILDQSKNLSEEIQEHHNELSAAQNQAVQQLRTEKDRPSVSRGIVHGSLHEAQ